MERPKLYSMTSMADVTKQPPQQPRKSDLLTATKKEAAIYYWRRATVFVVLWELFGAYFFHLPFLSSPSYLDSSIIIIMPSPNFIFYTILILPITIFLICTTTTFISPILFIPFLIDPSSLKPMFFIQILG